MVRLPLHKIKKKRESNIISPIFLIAADCNLTFLESAVDNESGDDIEKWRTSLTSGILALILLLLVLLFACGGSSNFSHEKLSVIKHMVQYVLWRHGQ